MIIAKVGERDNELLTDKKLRDSAEHFYNCPIGRQIRDAAKFSHGIDFNGANVFRVLNRIHEIGTREGMTFGEAFDNANIFASAVQDETEAVAS